MVRKKAEPQRENLPPKLAVTRLEAKERFEEQIKKGVILRDTNIKNFSELDQANNEYSKWSDYNKELLLRFFDNDTEEKKYEYSYRPGSVSISLSRGPSIAEKIDGFKKQLQNKINFLESLIDRLDLIPETTSMSPSNDLKYSQQIITSDIFIVHGHDDGAKETTARFIEKLDLNPIILHEKPNLGRTLIQKFEDHSNVSFAVIILTPDDVGASVQDKDNLKYRARQNVILELGFFLGKLGRKQVCALYEEGVEIPSDYEGVLYIPLDDSGAWKIKLAIEIKAAGISVDLNKVI